MTNTSERHLHIIAFATPYPPRYGGVIDVFYKIKALHKQGIRIHLHAFTYDKHPEREELVPYCESIHYYRRRTGWSTALSIQPYIVKSRMNATLLQNLLQNDYPILFEGMHTTGYINHPKLQHRLKVYRESNIEHHYYYHLFKSTKNLGIKAYHLSESFKLALFQRKLKYADIMLAVSKKDTDYLQESFPKKRVFHLPSFHPSEKLKVVPGHGTYALYHGNMSVSENFLAAEYLIKNVFSKTNIPFTIAGFNPPEALKKLASNYKNITLTENPDDETMTRLIQQAQVHVLVTFQATGLKLKLLNTLFNGRHILVNPPMVAGTLAENLCETGNNAQELLQKAEKLMQTPFEENDLTARKRLLDQYYSNTNNAARLIKLLFEK